MPKLLNIQKGFAKRWLIIIIPLFLIVFFVLMDLTAPADKKVLFKTPLTTMINTNPDSKPAYVLTNYKNSLPLDWHSTIFEIRSRDNNSLHDQTPSMYKVTDVNYCNAGDKKMVMDIYANDPVAPGSNRPMVMYIFGGGMIAGDKSKIDTDPAMVIADLVKEGFIVAAPNYRLAPQHKYPAMIQDLLCADRFLRYYSYGIGGNQNKLGVYGISVGGQLTMLVGATSGMESFENSPDENIAGANLSYDEYLKIPTKPNAAVASYGSARLPESPIAQAILKASGASWHNPFDNKTYPIIDMFKMIYNGDPKIMHEASAVNYVTENEPPFLIIQGDKDMLNPPDLSVPFYYELKAKGNNAEFLLVKNADHGLEPNPPDAVMDPSLDSVVNTTVDFFKSNLK